MLDDTRENVDLVGADRDAVIISAPPRVSSPATDPKDAITINGNGARNNSIRNLTIIVNNDGAASTSPPTKYGVAIKKFNSGGADPSNISISDVLIKNGWDPINEKESASVTGIGVVDSTNDIDARRVFLRTTRKGSPAVAGANSTRLTIANCDFRMFDGQAVNVGTNTTITDSYIEVNKDYGSNDGANVSDDTAAVLLSGKSGLRVSNCKLRARYSGLSLSGGGTDLLVTGTEMRGSHYGVRITNFGNGTFQNCRFSADSRIALGTGVNDQYDGVFVSATSDDLGVLRFLNCEIQAYTDQSSRDADGAHIEISTASNKGPVEFVACTISSEAATGGKRAFGVLAETVPGARLIGGKISSLDADEREDAQFDLKNTASSGGLGIYVVGTSFSKWQGPIGAVQPKTAVQRFLNVAAPSDTAVLASQSLTGSEQVLTTGFNPPDVYRALSIKGSQSGMNGTVILIGTNFAGDAIADKIQLNGTAAVKGKKPFQTLAKIILPAGSSQVAVGTTDELGYAVPLSASAAVQQLSKAVSSGGNTLYAVQSGVGTIDATYSRAVPPAAITTGDSFEWVVQASQ